MYKQFQKKCRYCMIVHGYSAWIVGSWESAYQAGVYDSIGSRHPFWHCVKLWLIHMQLRGLDNVLFGHCSELYALSVKQTFLSKGKTNVISISSLWGATHDPETNLRQNCTNVLLIDHMKAEWFKIISLITGGTLSLKLQVPKLKYVYRGKI